MPRFLSLALLSLLASTGLAAGEEPVTLQNFIRAETDSYFAESAAKGLGSWNHRRAPVAIDQQDVIRMNRDTIYSSAVFDLTQPVTITLPDAKGRFRSMLVINQDHYAKQVAYDAGEYTLTTDAVGTRYVTVVIRTFVDPNDPADIVAANALQDATLITQSSPGVLELPDWNATQRSEIGALLNQLAAYSDDSGPHFGDVGEVDPVARLVFTAAGWGGNPPQAAEYVGGRVDKADGVTPYSLTVQDVPVDGFWSITVYNDKGFMEAPADQVSINNVTAARNDDGSVTVHFGGDPAQPNYLRIMPGWNYVARLYRPQRAILDGSWQFPQPGEAG